MEAEQVGTICLKDGQKTGISVTEQGVGEMGWCLGIIR